MRRFILRFRRFKRGWIRRFLFDRLLISPQIINNIEFLLILGGFLLIHTAEKYLKMN